ncbi:COG4315 family predicted lipoprotein [Leekyejoonella antrihumi]|nr:hypothetical protein [Leekyejoonella antrihumi]
MRTSRGARHSVVVAVGVATLALAGCGVASSTKQAGSAASGPSVHVSASAAPPATHAPRPPIIKTVTIGERLTSLGVALVDPHGRTLYTYALDRNGVGACTGACAMAWPPVLVVRGARLGSRPMLPGRLRSTSRAGGGRQVTYDGHPLYTFSGDRRPGQTNGSGIKGVWFVALVNGTRPDPMSSEPPQVVSHAPTPEPIAPEPTQPAPPTTSRVPTNPIPQGGGGDGDGDNNGGPSDNDGAT